MKRPISSLYRGLCDMLQDNTLHVKDKWEKELEVEIDDDVWDTICSEIHKVTNANLWREFQWKVVIRYFKTPHILSKMDANRPDTCWRGCGDQIANHAHVFWSCPILDSFWRDVFNSLDSIFEEQIPRDPLVAILGAIPEKQMSRKKIYLLHILLAAAKKSITLNWLKIEPPTRNIWKAVVENIFLMEKITYKLRLQDEQFAERWLPWVRVERENGRE